MGIKVNGAIVASVLAAITHQASAGEVININQDKVDNEALDEMVYKMGVHGESLLTSNFEHFASAMVVDGEPIGIDIKAMLASGVDSTSLKRKSTAGCYTNCHSACHSSRSWR
jgi:hypothetical protein